MILNIVVSHGFTADNFPVSTSLYKIYFIRELVHFNSELGLLLAASYTSLLSLSLSLSLPPSEV
jgi:hypothetical protein